MSEQRQVLTSSPLERETETMDEYSNNVVSELLELTAANLSEQKLYIHSWETGERKTPEDDEDYYLADDLTQQDKERIKKFFNMRRVFAEHLGEVAEIKETITPCNPSTESTTAENTGDKSFFKKVKTAWKKCFSTKSKEEGVRTAEDEREELDSTSERAEEETKAEEELRSFPSQSSTCPIPSPNQVDEGIQLESQRAKEETSTSDQAGSSSQTSDRCSPVTEEVKLLIPQTVQDSVEILQCPESVSALNNTDSDNKNKKPARKSLFKRAQMTWKAGFGKKTSKKINRDEGSHKQDPDSSSLEGAKEEEELSLCLMPSPEEIDEVTPSEIQPTDESPKDLQEEPFSPWNRIIHVYKCEEEHLEIEAGGQPTESPLDSETLLKEEIRSLPPTATSSSAELSLCLMPSPKEMDEVTPSEIQPTDESPKDLQETLEEEEVSKDKSPTPERSPGKEEEPAVASENQQLVFESSEISAILERFFQSLSEEQWREVSEGVYNEGVKELLVVLCIDVLIFITDSVIKIVYQSIHQSSTTSDVLTLKSQTSSTRLTENFNDKIQGSFEKSFSQALHDVVGVDTHVRISSEFSQAIAGDVVREVTSALHTLIQAPLDEDFTGTPVPASCRVPKDKAGRKTLAGVIATMRSFLTGRVTSIKRKVLTKCSTEESKEKPTVQTWANQWERCFSASHRGRVHPFTSPDLDAADTSARAELSGATTDLPPSKMKYIPLEIVDISEDEEMTHQDHPSVISPVFVTKPIPQDHLVLEDPDKTDDEKSPTKSQISDSGVSEITASVSDSESKKKKKKSFWSFLCCIFRKNEDKKKNKDNNGQEKPKRCCCCCCCWMRLLCCCCTENEPP
ncbi:uncharacterized protein LOC117827375 isoform X3 [Notolabrus celidotus]|uniref:uncharacterized protein LOC117827375 isoform X3 n=1 Tax=Notolabrus celidotus TaxID=1203425 RepID=UPI00148F8F0A|nr:uncharacterized protein LOC117827375 isoform X3 [Notolabrus celidotus]